MKYKHTETGADLYYIQRQPLPGTQHLDRDTATLVSYAPADWTDYAQALTESPAGGYIYGATHATVSNGPYIYDIYKRIGASPAITDTLLATIYGYWGGSTLHIHMPLAANGYLMTDLQSFLGTQLTSLDQLKASAPLSFHILPTVRRGATSTILRIPITRKDGEPSGGGLTHESTGLFIAVKPNNAATPTYMYSAFDSELEPITTIGTYEAPTAGKARFGFATPAGMYEIHLSNDIFNHTGATNLTVTISGHVDHAITICEVPLVVYDFESLSNQINLLPEASTTRAFANPVFDYDLTTGTYISGTIENTQSTLDPDLVFSPSATDPLVVEVQFICNDGMADTLEITGRAAGTGGTEASREVSVWAYNIAATAWTELSTGGTRIPVSAINAVRDYQIQPQHQDQTTGVVRIQFRSQRADAADRLYLDRMDVTVIRAGISVSQIVQGVHYTKVDESIIRNVEHNLPAWFWWQIRPIVFALDSIVGNDVTCSGTRFDATADYVGHTIQFHLGGSGTFRFTRVTAQAGAVLTVDDIQDVTDAWHGYVLTNRNAETNVSGLTTAQAQLLKDIAALVLV